MATNTTQEKQYEKRLSKFNNGYILEYGTGQNPKQRDSIVVFSAFFNPFSDSYQVLQTIRDYIIVRNDKPRSFVTPRIESFKEVTSEEKLFEECFSNLEAMINEDTIPDRNFPTEPSEIYQGTVQDYFFSTLYTLIDKPEFEENINVLQRGN